MDRGNGPKLAYSALIGRLVLPGQVVTEAEIERLPDPALFRDAIFLARNGHWSPSDLDATDALLLSLVRKMQNTRAQ